MTKYHSIRFVLDVAYEDHNKLHDKEQDWGKWFKYIIKMFDNNIPVSLLKGLAKKNNTHLSRLLDLYNSSIFTFKKEKNEKNEKKINDEYNSWIKRRDDGNKRAALEKELKKREFYEKDVIQRRKSYEIYCNKMQPLWDTKLQEVISARQNILDKIY